MSAIPTDFTPVTAVTKANIYFDGKVVSHSILFPDGSKKTLGLIYPGKYHFGTEKAERMEIVASLRVVDEVFVEESLEQKRDYIIEHGADVLVMGDDWAGKFDWVGDVCEVVYLPRTPSVSTRSRYACHVA